MRLFLILCLLFVLSWTTAPSFAQSTIPEVVRTTIAQSEVTISFVSNGKPMKVLGIADAMRIYGQPPTTSMVLINAYGAPYAANFSIISNGRAFSGRAFMFDSESGTAMLTFEGSEFNPVKVPKSFSGLLPNNEYIVSSLDVDGRWILQVAKVIGYSSGRTMLTKLQGTMPVRNGNVYNMDGEWVGFVQNEGIPSDGLIYIVDGFTVELFKNFSTQLSVIWTDADPEFKKLSFDEFMRWARITPWTNNLTIRDMLSVDLKFLNDEKNAPSTKAMANKIRADFRIHASEVAKQQIYLDCLLQSSESSRRTLDIHVDLIAKTANGWPANIDDAKISFSPSAGKTIIIVNRYTGAATMDMAVDDGLLRKGQNIAMGNCQLRGKDKKF